MLPKTAGFYLILAILCFFTFSNTSYAVENSQVSATQEEAREMALDWLQLMDSRDYSRAYSLLSSAYLTSMSSGGVSDPKPYWIKNMGNAREKLGKNYSREIYRVTPTDQLKSGRGVSAIGQYIIFDIKGNFSLSKNTIETISLQYEDGYWRVSSYIFRPQ